MSKTKKTETVVKSLEDIGQAAKGLKLSLPKLPMVPNLSGLTATVEEMQAAAHQIEEGVANALKFVDETNRKLAGCKDNIEKKVVTRARKSIAEKMKQYLDDVLNLEDGVLKAAAAVAYIKTALTRHHDNSDEARETLAELESRKLLNMADHDGRIIIGYQHYSVGPFELDEHDLAEVIGAVSEFSRGMVVVERQRRDKQVEDMRKQGQIDLDGVKAGKNGRCLVDVPPESFFAKVDDGKGGKKTVEKWRGGGLILMDFQKDYITPIRASGSVENLVYEMVGMRVKLQRYTLGKEVPPGFGSYETFQRAVEAVKRIACLNHTEAQAYVKKEQALWYLIQRGIKSHESEKLRAESKATLLAKANITAAQFFGLNGSKGELCKGTAFLEFRGTFKQDVGPELTDPFFLVKRGEDGGAKFFFEVAEVPPHLKEIIGHHVGKNFPGYENDRECPPQLGRLLRAIRGKEEMAINSVAAVQ